MTVLEPNVSTQRPTRLGFLFAFAASAALSGCQYMPHAYQPHSPQIPEARTVPIPGAILTYTATGSGKSILFVHGNIADLRVWTEQRGLALKDYQCVSYSRRYHYPNAWDGKGADYTEANNDKDLVNIIRELHLAPVNLVGQGSAAQIAVEVALSHPELVRTLVLVEPEMATVASGREGFAPLALDRDQLTAQLLTAVRMDQTEKAATLLFNWSDANPHAYETLPLPLQGEILDNATVLPFFLAAPPPPMQCAELARLAMPTLVMTGAHSNPFFAAVADAVKACIHGAERVTIPAAGHVVQRDNPETFNAVLTGFLTTH